MLVYGREYHCCTLRYKVHVPEGNPLPLTRALLDIVCRLSLLTLSARKGQPVTTLPELCPISSIEGRMSLLTPSTRKGNPLPLPISSIRANEVLVDALSQLPLPQSCFLVPTSFTEVVHHDDLFQQFWGTHINNSMDGTYEGRQSFIVEYDHHAG